MASSLLLHSASPSTALLQLPLSSSSSSARQFHHFRSDPRCSQAGGVFSPNEHNPTYLSASEKWRTRVSFYPAFLNARKSAEAVKEELLEAIAPLDRGAEATPEDQERVEKLVRKLEGLNPTKQPVKSKLLNGKWELIYTTSRSISESQRPKFLRSFKLYQGINVDTLRAQNFETWPFFNQVTSNLTPVNSRKVVVKFDYFKVLGMIPVKASDRFTGSLETTYLDEELRISRGDLGNLFILRMVDPSYRVPV